MVSSDHQDWKNKLYFGDNLNVLREHVQDETADLIYLDPPFNSNATYNVLFREKGGEQSAAQITAFEDTWRWGLDKVLPSSSAPQGPRVLRGEALGAPGHGPKEQPHGLTEQTQPRQGGDVAHDVGGIQPLPAGAYPQRLDNSVRGLLENQPATVVAHQANSEGVQRLLGQVGLLHIQPQGVVPQQSLP